MVSNQCIYTKVEPVDIAVQLLLMSLSHIDYHYDHHFNTPTIDSSDNDYNDNNYIGINNDKKTYNNKVDSCA